MVGFRRSFLAEFSSKAAFGGTSFLLRALLVGAFVLVGVSSNKFDPYQQNGGLVCAVAGKDFCVVAADTRMSAGYLLPSRHHLSTRLWTVYDDLADAKHHSSLLEEVQEILQSQNPFHIHSHNQDLIVARQSTGDLSDSPILIASAGCSTDCQALQTDLRADLRAARHFGQTTSVADANSSRSGQVATRLSQLLYQRRGFPYYVFCVVGALDVDERGDGEGCGGRAYTYDAIGSYEQVAVATAGTGRQALQPILDRLFATRDEAPDLPKDLDQGRRKQVQGTVDETIRKLRQAYRSVSEREIEVGDQLVLHISELIPSSKEEDEDSSTTKTRNRVVQSRVVVFPLKGD